MSGIDQSPTATPMHFGQRLTQFSGLRLPIALVVGLLGWCAISSVAQSRPVPQTTIQDSLLVSLQQRLQQATQDTSRIVLIGELAVRYHQLGEKEQALTQLQKGLSAAKRTNNPLNLGRIYHQLGAYYDRQSMYAPSVVAYRKAIVLLQQAHQVAEATSVMYLLARLYTAHSDMQQAVNQINTNLAYADQTKCFTRVVATYTLLASIHGELNNRPGILTALKAMMKAAYQYRNPADICVAHGTAAELYRNEHADKKAEHEYQLALRAGLQLPDRPDLVSQSYCALASFLSDQNRLAEAETAIGKAFQQLAKDKRIPVWNARLVLANLRDHQNRLAEAQQLVRSGLNYARTGNYPTVTLGFLATLYSIQEKQGNYQQALATYQEMKTLSDSLQEIRKVRLITTLEAKLGVERSKKDIAILKENAAIAKLELARTRQRQLTYASLIVGLILLITLVGWFSWQTRRKNRTLEQQQNEILTQAEHLQELNTLKDKLFMMIGHDLRSPVMTLKNNLNKLTAEPLSAEQLTLQTDQLKRTLDTVYTTLDNLLHWAALQGEGILTRQRPISLAPLVTETLALLEPVIAHKQLHLTVNEADVVGWTDEYQAQIVIRNIVHNAIKFTPPGGQITIRFAQSDKEAVVLVTDTGVGMKTTDPLQAASLSNRRGTLGETGTGLGLQVCNELMKRNDGRLLIDSTVGQGTTVRLIFTAEVNNATQPYRLPTLNQPANSFA